MSFNKRVLSAIQARKSNLCVGLDPDLKKISDKYAEIGVRSEFAAKMKAALDTYWETAEFAAAFKPNAAFYEFVGDGGESLALLLKGDDQYSDKPIVIFDGKRGDIGNTCDQYANKILTVGGYDAVTVNPLMGYDCVEPFLRDPERGIFILCLTSNPGAEDFLLQHELYLRIAEKAVQWNVNDNVGLVVGATRPEYAAAIRNIAPDLPLLIPGVGAQGGALEEIVDAIHGKQNRNFLINASRSIMFAKGGQGAGAREAKRIRDEINKVLEH